jgi:hypothetical protein
MPKIVDPDFDSGWVSKADWTTAGTVTLMHNLDETFDNLDVHVYLQYGTTSIFEISNTVSDVATNAGTFVKGNSRTDRNRIVFGYGPGGGATADQSGSTFNASGIKYYRCVIYKRKERISIVNTQLVAQDGLQQRGSFSVTTTGSTVTSGIITFPTPFASVPHVSLIRSSNPANWAYCQITISAVTTTQFTWNAVNTSSVTVTDLVFTWQATAGSTTDLQQLQGSWIDIPYTLPTGVSTVGTGTFTSKVRWNNAFSLLQINLRLNLSSSASLTPGSILFTLPFSNVALWGRSFTFPSSALLFSCIAGMDNGNTERRAIAISFHPDGTAKGYSMLPQVYAENLVAGDYWINTLTTLPY